MKLTVNSISLHQDAEGWWVLSELFKGGPAISFLFWNTAWVCFKARVEEVIQEEVQNVRPSGSGETVQ